MTLCPKASQCLESLKNILFSWFIVFHRIIMFFSLCVWIRFQDTPSPVLMYSFLRQYSASSWDSKGFQYCFSPLYINRESKFIRNWMRREFPRSKYFHLFEILSWPLKGLSLSGSSFISFFHVHWSFPSPQEQSSAWWSGGGIGNLEWIFLSFFLY